MGKASGIWCPTMIVHTVPIPSLVTTDSWNSYAVCETFFKLLWILVDGEIWFLLIEQCNIYIQGLFRPC